jgi:hypothetical protein
MAWKVSRNEPSERVEQWICVCPKANDKAIITASYTGSQWCETDLGKTYSLAGWKCSLLEEKKFLCSRDTCPYKPSQYL